MGFVFIGRESNTGLGRRFGDTLILEVKWIVVYNVMDEMAGNLYYCDWTVFKFLFLNSLFLIVSFFCEMKEMLV